MPASVPMVHYVQSSGWKGACLHRASTCRPLLVMSEIARAKAGGVGRSETEAASKLADRWRPPLSIDVHKEEATIESLLRSRLSRRDKVKDRSPGASQIV